MGWAEAFCVSGWLKQWRRASSSTVVWAECKPRGKGKALLWILSWVQCRLKGWHEVCFQWPMYFPWSAGKTWITPAGEYLLKGLWIAGARNGRGVREAPKGLLWWYWRFLSGNVFFWHADEQPVVLLSQKPLQHKYYMWQAGLGGGAEGEGRCDDLFHCVGTDWCGSAAKWKAGRQSISLK